MTKIAPRITTTWAVPQLPLAWVTEHEGALWIVPARAGGWNAKLPYKGHHPSKIPTAQVVDDNTLMSTGIPTKHTT